MTILQKSKGSRNQRCRVRNILSEQFCRAFQNRQALVCYATCAFSEIKRARVVIFPATKSVSLFSPTRNWRNANVKTANLQLGLKISNDSQNNSAPVHFTLGGRDLALIRRNAVGIGAVRICLNLPHPFWRLGNSDDRTREGSKQPQRIRTAAKWGT